MRSLIDILELTTEELSGLISVANDIIDHPQKYAEACKGKKLAKDNFAHLAPSPVNVVLEYSHPPLSERIGAIERLLKNK